MKLFFYKLIAPTIYELPAPNTILKAKHPFFSWYSSSSFTKSRICSSKHIPQHGLYNVSSIGDFKKQASEHDHDHDQVGKKRWTPEGLFGRHSFTSQIHHHHRRCYNRVLTKLSSYSILSFYPKPENYTAPSTLSGISVLKQSSYLFLSLGALRQYHNYRKPSRAPKKYKKPARIRRYVAPKEYSKLAPIVKYVKHATGFIKHVYNYRVLYLASLGIIPTIIFGRLETVPYTKRKHILVVPPSKDKSIGDLLFDQNELTVLPQNHPDSVRVRCISNQLLQALHAELKLKGTNDLDFSVRMVDEKEEEKVPWWKEVQVPWRKLDKLSPRHLDGLKWQVVVVNSSTLNAYCLPGKIVVYAGLLKHLKSDAQVATVIGHEVGHVVARHTAEAIMRRSYSLSFYHEVMNKKCKNMYSSENTGSKVCLYTT